MCQAPASTCTPNYFGGSVAALLARPDAGAVRWSPQQALDFMDRQGIAAQMLSLPLTPARTSEDPGFAMRLARAVNGGIGGAKYRPALRGVMIVHKRFS